VAKVRNELKSIRGTEGIEGIEGKNGRNGREEWKEGIINIAFEPFLFMLL